MSETSHFRTSLIQYKYDSRFVSNVFQVLGFAAFFALVLKKVEQEDEENTAIDGPLSAPGNLLYCSTLMALDRWDTTMLLKNNIH